MGNIETSKAASIEKLHVRFLKDGTEILSKPISEICNLSFSPEIFPNSCKLQNSNVFSRKLKKSTHLITGLSPPLKQQFFLIGIHSMQG